MKKVWHLVVLVILLAVATPTLAGQNDDRSVPQFVRFAGTLSPAHRESVVPITFAIYSDAEGGAALWSEAQSVPVDANGRYTILLGSASSEGLPAAIFATNEARWLGVQVLANAEPEQQRVLLVSVPYALKAQDADRLGGRSLADFVLQSNLDRRLSELGTPSSSKRVAAGKVSAAASSVDIYGASFTDPTLANNYKWLELTTQTPGGKYNGTLYNFPQPGDPAQDNWVMRLGYNILGGGGREDETRPAITLEWESNFSPYAGQNVQEFHLTHVGMTGVVQRPISLYRPTLGVDSLSLSNSVLQLGDATGTIKALFGQNGRFDWYMAPQAPDNERIYFLRTNRNRQADNNSGSVSTIAFQKLDANDYWQIGNGFTVSHATGNIGMGSIPVSDVRMRVRPSSTVNGLDMYADSAPPHFFLRATLGGVDKFKVDGAGNTTISGTVASGLGFIGNLTGTASKASAFAANPADCLTARFATGIAANGDLTCAAIQASDVPSLSGSYVDLTSPQTIGGIKTFVGPVTTTAPLITAQSYSVQQTVPFSATPIFDAGAGNNFKLTLTDNVTSSQLTNAVAGQTLVFLLCQDATGGYSFTWPTNFRASMVIGAEANKCSIQQFYFDGTDAYALTTGLVNQ